MKLVYTGLESSGKSLLLSKTAEKIRQRNAEWYEITGIKRTMAFNTPMSEKFKKEILNSNINYKEWKNFEEIAKLTEADIFIDELIKIFPASGTTPLSMEQLDFLTQGAKNGVHLYCASQDFSQVHK